MGLIGKLVEAAVDANEEAHGVRLLRGLEDTKRCLAALQEDVRADSIGAFLARRQDLLRQIKNWSVEGRLKEGKKLQGEARGRSDFDQSESYALWMTGAWLESGVRKSPKARSVHQSLETLALDVGGEQAAKAKQLAQLIGSFSDCWLMTLNTATGLAGLRELPPFGDKHLAILWGATIGLANSIDANYKDRAAALIIFLEGNSDRADVFRRMSQLSKDPQWGGWIDLATESVATHISGTKDASEAYMPLATRYLKAGGG